LVKSSEIRKRGKQKRDPSGKGERDSFASSLFTSDSDLIHTSLKKEEEDQIATQHSLGEPKVSFALLSLSSAVHQFKVGISRLLKVRELAVSAR
jgi:hypothetical protein